MSVTLSRLAARRLQRLAAGQVSDADRAVVASCLLDLFGAVLGAHSSSWAPGILSVAIGGPAEAHVWGRRGRVAAREAAFANSVLAHSLLRDDMHVASGSHPGSIILPAMIALAQREGASGATLGAAIIAGYEMLGALGAAVRAGGVSRRFRPSGIVGAFGAAAGASVLLELDEEQTVSALGFGANMGAGLNEWPWTGGLEGFAQMGTAARNGMVAAELARTGMAASEGALDGSDGLFAAYASDPSRSAKAFAEALLGGAVLAQIRFKPVPGCSLVQSPVAAALALARDRQLRSEDITSITITTTASAQSYPGCDSRGPFTSVVQAKMSLQFGVAAALRFGWVDEEAFLLPANAELIRLIAATSVVVDPVLTAATPDRQPARVELTLSSGEVVGRELAGVPWLDEEAVEDRFRTAAAERGLSTATTDRVVAMSRELWTLASIEDLVLALAEVDPVCSRARA